MILMAGSSGSTGFVDGVVMGRAGSPRLVTWPGLAAYSWVWLVPVAEPCHDPFDDRFRSVWKGSGSGGTAARLHRDRRGPFHAVPRVRRRGRHR
jgi:hypothetical protein